MKAAVYAPILSLALALAACQGAKPGPEQYGIFRM